MQPQGNATGERGMVTVELALVSMLAAVGAMILCWLVGVVVILMHCHDTAAEVARQEARDDTAAVARARAGAPTGATVEVDRSAGLVTVTVSVRAGSPLAGLPQIPLSARAVVLTEGS